MARVSQPAMSIMVVSATPAWRNWRAALRRKSCGVVPVYLNRRPPHLHLLPVTVFSQLLQVNFPKPVSTHNFCQQSRKSLTGFWPRVSRGSLGFLTNTTISYNDDRELAELISEATKCFDSNEIARLKELTVSSRDSYTSAIAISQPIDTV